MPLHAILSSVDSLPRHLTPSAVTPPALANACLIMAPQAVRKSTGPRQQQAVRQEQRQAVAISTAIRTRVETETASIIDQAVTVKQSTEVAQCFVLGAISSLAYTRNIFPDHCFENQHFDVQNNESAYDAFAEEQNNEEASQRKGTTRMYVLKRGRSVRVDKFLSWLEEGVFDALQKGHLLGLHITILADRDQPANVLEAYTFTFHYTVQDDGSHSVTSFEVDGSGQQPMTLRMVRIAMRQLIRQTFVYCQRLPALPENRYLKMHLTYNDTRPSNYHPPYFGDGEDDEMFYPDADWKMIQETAGAIDTGHHTICLGITHLELEDMDELDSVDLDNLTIPPNLDYCAPASRFDALDVDRNEKPIVVPKPKDSNKGTHQTIPSEQSNGSRTALYQSDVPQGQGPAGNTTPTPPRGKEVDLNVVRSLPRAEVEASQMPPTSLLKLSSTSVRSSQIMDLSQPDDVFTRERLKVMLQPSLSGDVDHNTQQQNTQVPTQEMRKAAPRLSQTVVGELEKRRSKQLPPRHSGLAKLQDSLKANVSDSTDSVICECEDNTDDLNVIQCSFCMKWQHLQCYGYRRDGIKMPAEDHACYRCLLQEKDASLWDDLRWLALMRRAIHHLKMNGFSTNKQLQTDLKRPAATTSLVINELLKKGFLAHAIGSRKVKTAKPKYILNRDESVWRGILRDYFDPVSKIAHYFQLPEMQQKAANSTQLSPSYPQLRNKRQVHMDVETVTPKRLRRNTATSTYTLAVDEATPDHARF